MCCVTFLKLTWFVDYDDDNVGGDSYYGNVDEQRIDEAISSHDPTTERQTQISMNKFWQVQ